MTDKRIVEEKMTTMGEEAPDAMTIGDPIEHE